MTIDVRIEHASNLQWSDTRRVRVTLQIRVYEGAPEKYIRTDRWMDSSEPAKLLHPTQLASVMITDDRRLIVEEYDEGAISQV